MSERKSKLSRVRAAAGRAGAAARWQGERERTTMVRVYAEDAAWLKSQPGTIAEVVRRLRDGQ